MIVTVANTKEEWDTWVLASETPRSSGVFLQSWMWGEFQKAVGRRVVRLVVEDQGKTMALAQMICMSGPLHTSYWYCPRGPLAIEEGVERAEVMTALFQFIQDSREMRGALFLRYDPCELWPHALSQPGPMMQPWATRVLDLTIREDALLAAMKPKTRYNIRVAERHDVKITQRNSEKAMKHFWKLARQTAKRQGIAFHPHRYYTTMQQVYEKCEDFWIAEAEYNSEVIASGIFVRYGDAVTYLHGASSNVMKSEEKKQVMAPYLLQWRAICDARKRGVHTYDFWGVAATPRQEQTWAGITRFKEGFGGARLECAHTQEIPLRKNLFCLYRIFHI